MRCLSVRPAQARKQRRAVEQVAPLLAAARGELAYLAEVEVMLQQLQGSSHLAALAEVQVGDRGVCECVCVWRGAHGALAALHIVLQSCGGTTGAVRHSPYRPTWLPAST